MDNLISNTLPGGPLAASAPGANGATLADKWQNELMASAFMLPEQALGTRQSVTTEPALDTAAILSFQSIMVAQGTPVTNELSQHYLDAMQTISVSNTPTLAEISIVPSGQSEPVDARLLGWGNVGQGILSYISASNGISSTQLQAATNDSQAHSSPQAAGITLPSASQGVDAATPKHLRYNPLYAAAMLAKAGSTANNVSKLQQHTSANTFWGYDITPQALFFVLTEQQGYRATVRDYFTKDATQKRLHELRQDGSFNFTNVQEIWLNGKPLNTPHNSGD
jgi:hypothetical protein